MELIFFFLIFCDIINHSKIKFYCYKVRVGEYIASVYNVHVHSSGEELCSPVSKYNMVVATNGSFHRASRRL